MTECCRCEATGDPHYITYDNALINFYGICKYTLTKSTLPKGDACAFDVEVKNEQRFGIEESFIRMIDLKLNNGMFEIRLLQNSVVQMFKKDINLPYFAGNMLMIYMSEGVLMVKSPSCDISAEWNGFDEFIFEAPDKYKNKMIGLCGNCDGKAENDVTTSAGATLVDTPDNQNVMGLSFEVPDDSDAPTKK
ncbi:BMP-binding endothelial regulator protein-like [Tubulanus polymorphus]|uniref:BMP-binding endothelial regulator protein-like n=1 Tax=Tubulanus polymorphus TaxID=672921 RepID=UPI003DA5DA35